MEEMAAVLEELQNRMAESFGFKLTNHEDNK